MDAISLVSMLINPGFSVNYSALICYHYHTHEEDEEVPRVSLVADRNGLIPATFRNPLFSKSNRPESPPWELKTEETPGYRRDQSSHPFNSNGLLNIIEY